MVNEMIAKHLVTDSPQNNIESMLNYAYAKDEKVYLRYANGTEDMDLCEYVSQLTQKQGCNLPADEVMVGSCIEGCDCEVGVLYSLAVQAAELRERLKRYETLEDQGLLQTLPCKAGENVWVVEKDEITCYMFLAKSKGCIIATSWINDYDLDETIEYHILETQDNLDTALAVFPEEYCFDSKEKAEQKVKEILGVT